MAMENTKLSIHSRKCEAALMSDPAILPHLVYIFFGTIYLVSMVLGDVLLWRLRRRHPETWETLGRPNYIFGYRIRESVTMLRFLWRREYRSLPDERSIRLAAFVRGFFAASLVVCVVGGGLLAVVFVNVFKQAIATVREMRGELGKGLPQKQKPPFRAAVIA
jgi:hypothetical protein